MANRIGKGGAAAGTLLGILLVAVILILVNVIAAGNFFRLDLTEGKEFTISKATKDMVRDLDDLVTITVYMSAELPTQLSTLRRQISDILDEYRNFGRGNIQVEFVDPISDPELEQRMRGLGIPMITAQTLEKDQFQSVNIYLGMLVSHLDRQEVIPVVQDTYTLEYDLTSAILKIASERTYKVGVLAGNTIHALDSSLTGMKELLQKQFTVVPVNLGDGTQEVAGDIDLLVVPGPNEIPDEIEYQIDQYLMRGGKIIFMIDAIRLAEGGGLQATPLRSGIEDLLAHYGVRVQNALTLDRGANATASFSSGYVRYTLPYPYWVKSIPDLLNAEHPITGRLESIVLPWVAPIELDVEIAAGDPLGKIEELAEAQREAQREIAEKLGVDLPAQEQDEVGDEGEDATEEEAAEPTGSRYAHVLARTSPQSWTISGHYDLNPQQRFAPAGGKMSPQITAVALTGTFDSFYTEHPVPQTHTPPVVPEEPEGEAGDEVLAASEPLGEPTLHSPETQIIVIGNAQFATDQFLTQFGANTVFLQNAIDYLTLGDQLISIRSRGATDRPLKQVSDASKSSIKIAGMLGTPALVILFGLVRFLARRKTMAAREVAAARSK